ncbi:hypothetical protein E3N88_11681 [Mikania micrantha]|uniref:Uncharacterized protein n=1 Tax=Mikania micrantha TaxID=192012 RepID=A0A5N6P3P5_9ASTR|nr:hypothetical protein E3N88_11681 [Mikania micrantha]
MCVDVNLGFLVQVGRRLPHQLHRPPHNRHQPSSSQNPQHCGRPSFALLEATTGQMRVEIGGFAWVNSGGHGEKEDGNKW